MIIPRKFTHKPEQSTIVNITFLSSTKKILNKIITLRGHVTITSIGLQPKGS